MSVNFSENEILADECDRCNFSFAESEIIIEIETKLKQRQIKDQRKTDRILSQQKAEDVKKLTAQNREMMNFFYANRDNMYDGVSKLFEEVLYQPDERFKVYENGEWIGCFSRIGKTTIVTTDHLFDDEDEETPRAVALGHPSNVGYIYPVRVDHKFLYATYDFAVPDVTKLPPVMPLAPFRDGTTQKLMTEVGPKELVARIIPETCLAVTDSSHTGPGWSGFPLNDGCNTFGVYNSISGCSSFYAIAPPNNDKLILVEGDFGRTKIGFLCAKAAIPDEKQWVGPVRSANRRWVRRYEMSEAAFNAANDDLIEESDGFVDPDHFYGDERRPRLGERGCRKDLGIVDYEVLYAKKGKTKRGRGRLHAYYKRAGKLSSEEYDDIKQAFFDAHGYWPDEYEMDEAINARLEGWEAMVEAEELAEEDDQEEYDEAMAAYEEIQEQIREYKFGTGGTVGKLSKKHAKMLGLDAAKLCSGRGSPNLGDLSDNPPAADNSDQKKKKTYAAAANRDIVADGTMAVQQAMFDARMSEPSKTTASRAEDSSSDDDIDIAVLKAKLAKLEAKEAKKNKPADPVGDIARKYSEMKKEVANQAYKEECNLLETKIHEYNARGVVVPRTVVLSELEERKYPRNEHYKQTLLKHLRELKNIDVVNKAYAEKRERAQAAVISNQEKLNKKIQEVEEVRMALKAAEQIISEVSSQKSEERRNFSSKPAQ